jgi:Uma2 family endonuclease
MFLIAIHEFRHGALLTLSLSIRYPEKQMQVILPDITAPARFFFESSASLSDNNYFLLCAANRDLRIERSAKGDIILSPSVGCEADYRSTEVSAQLHQWAKLDDSLAKFSQEQHRKFLPLAPEFVIEVLSPSDRFNAAMEKMKKSGSLTSRNWDG